MKKSAAHPLLPTVLPIIQTDTKIVIQTTLQAVLLSQESTGYATTAFFASFAKFRPKVLAAIAFLFFFTRRFP